MIMSLYMFNTIGLNRDYTAVIVTVHPEGLTMSIGASDFTINRSLL